MAKIRARIAKEQRRPMPRSSSARASSRGTPEAVAKIRERLSKEVAERKSAVDKIRTRLEKERKRKAAPFPVQVKVEVLKEPSSAIPRLPPPPSGGRRRPRRTTSADIQPDLIDLKAESKPAQAVTVLPVVETVAVRRGNPWDTDRKHSLANNKDRIMVHTLRDVIDVGNGPMETVLAIDPLDRTDRGLHMLPMDPLAARYDSGEQPKYKDFPDLIKF